MASIAVYTLGCRANQYESLMIKKAAAECGFKIVAPGQSADIYVINTCTVTQHAEKKSRQAINRFRRFSKNTKIIATGCMTKQPGKPLGCIRGIDLVLDNKNKSEIKKHLHALLPRNQFMPDKLSLPVRNNLMIQDGCAQFCSYCIVPLVRGKNNSKALDQILSEAAYLAKNGTKEIVLTGINLGSYGIDLSTKISLKQVLKALLKISGLLRVRISSLEPMHLDKDLIDYIASEKRICRHLHVPLQSADDRILKAMRRPYTFKEYIALVGYARKKIRGLALSTDVIIGFPGESEASFKRALVKIRKTAFSRVHFFSFSSRPGTAAALLPDKINPKTIQLRAITADKLRSKLMLLFARQYKLKSLEVLVELVRQDHKLEGYSSNYIKVRFSGSNKLIGKIVNVKISKVNAEYCEGVLC